MINRRERDGAVNGEWFKINYSDSVGGILTVSGEKHLLLGKNAYKTGYLGKNAYFLCLRIDFSGSYMGNSNGKKD